MPVKKKRKAKSLKVELVYNPSPDAEDRVRRAFEMLLTEKDLDDNSKNKNDQVS